jgi:hypothetical protein
VQVRILQRLDGGALDLVLQLVGELVGVRQVPDEERRRERPGCLLDALVRVRTQDAVDERLALGEARCP